MNASGKSGWSSIWSFTAATTSIAHGRSAKAAAAARIQIGTAGSKLFVRNAEAGNVVSVYDMSGRLLLRATVLSSEQAIVLPSSMGISGKSLAVSVRSAGTTFWSVVVMP